MPAAAVIPAPIAYIKVVAVKKLVVGSGLHGYMPWWILWLLLSEFCLVSWSCDLSAVSVYAGAGCFNRHALGCL